LAVVLAASCQLPAASLLAQDSTQSGVRVGITYAPGTRPSLSVVLFGAALLDSASVTLARDLEQSDRFEILPAPSSARDQQPPGLNLQTFSALGAAYVVTLSVAGSDVTAVAMDTRTGQEATRVHLFAADVPDKRLAVHRGADELVRALTGQPGIAATSVLFVHEGRVMRVDADGANAQLLRTAGWPSLSPAWSADGRLFAYTAYVRSGEPIVVQDFSGAREMIPGTEDGLNITPAFSPDGRRLAYAHGTEAGTDIYLSQTPGRDVHDWGRAGEPQRLTVGRGADNLSPSWSPDGARIAFISNRARTPQLYVMGADGTGQEVLARFDFGATGTTSAPSWSPDGQQIAFHREVAGTPQVFVLDVATRAIRQLTGSSRNEDPAWAPDNRHLVFVSSRSGTRELWVVDVETGRLRQLTRAGGARLPAWSPRTN
jgi:TolB protein